MMSHFLAALLLLVFATDGHSAEPKLPILQSCAPVIHCEAGLGKLNEEEVKVITRLLDTVAPGSTEAQITQKLGRAPFDATPPMAAWGQPPGTTTNKALWSLADPPARSSGPHFDVLFINSRAVMFSWYAAGLKKLVRAQVAP